MRYAELCESRAAPLYHFTRLEKLFEVVRADQLGVEGASLTRDANTPYFSHGFWNHVALVLDQEKLAHRFAFDLRSGDMYADDTGLFMKPGHAKERAKEAEERVERPIKPLHAYLRAIVLSDSEITTKLILAMRKRIAGKPLAKWWPKFEEMIKRQGSHPDWNRDALDPEKWRALFDYCQTHQVPLLTRPLRATFGKQRANLWHREFH